MNRTLLDLALERLKKSDWERFEQFCSQFLAEDFPSMRTMANPSGDGGRDSMLFSPTGVDNVAFQYSVSENWKDKIGRTLRRLRETYPDVRVVVYMSNQVIGARGDDVKSKALAKGVSLDIRDRNWFLERFEQDTGKQSASATLIDEVATPYLEGKEVIERRSHSLTSQEARAALVYLGMQWEDDNTQKGLTKLAHEALVRSALRNTNSEYRIARSEIHKIIRSYLPSTDSSSLEKYTNAALSRLEKRFIRHHAADDSYCLTHDEVLRLRDKLASQDSDETKIESEIKESIAKVCGGGDGGDSDFVELVARVRRVIDAFLLKSGEVFAGSVMSGTVMKLDGGDINNLVYSDIAEHPIGNKADADIVGVVQQVIIDLLSSPKEFVRRYLRKASDAYTLFAFLKETADVQSATKKIFSYGNIWLDTTVLLPLLIEALKEEEEKVYAKIFRALRDAGVKLFVTKGVIQEVSTHTNRCISCASYNPHEWEGSIPYVFREYMQLGYSKEKFRAWMETFRGYERPEDDLADYLAHEYGISIRSLEEEALLVDQELRFAIERMWQEAHETRRKGRHKQEIDDSVMAILVRHDVESYLGVIGLRSKETASELGYKNWWLTIDKVAWSIRDAIKEEFNTRAPSSPLISLDFLTGELAFGPSRGKIDREGEAQLPVFLDIDFSEVVPAEIIDIAEKVRNENSDLPERVIRRKVRDACDRARRRMGQETRDAINAEQGA